MPDSALNRRSEALSGWKHNKCPLLPLNYPENHFLVASSKGLFDYDQGVIADPPKGS